MYRIYRLIHQRMGTHKVYSLVREGFSCVEIRGEGTSRTLKQNEKEQNRIRYQEDIKLVFISNTHSSRPRIRDFASVGCPLIVVTMFVREGSIEDISDVSHRVHTYSRAFKHRPGEKKREAGLA